MLPRFTVLSIALALVLAALAAPAEAQKKPGPKTAKQLFDAFRAVPGVRATYREAKTLSVLDEELISEGMILFAPPTQLVRVTTKPMWSSMVVKEKSLVLRDASGTQKLPAAKGSQARAFVQVFVDVARGDQAALEKYFVIKFESSGDAWKVALVPRNKKKLPIKSITLTGSATDLKTMTLVDKLGDKTAMTFLDVDISRRPSASEVKKALRKP